VFVEAQFFERNAYLLCSPFPLNSTSSNIIEIVAILTKIKKKEYWAAGVENF
jgi:hypothetical protein